MSDRKYRQRGYQDEPRDRDRSRPADGPPKSQGDPGPRGEQIGPKTPNLMGSREVFRCARCGHLLALPVEAEGRCPKCATDLHSCVQCVSFDTGARFECAQAIPARVSPKDARNACTLFAPRTTVERQTGTAGPTSARSAFDDLFKS